ncbi:hypothetical protein EMQU_1197 [Enterococcus mundtii QU 25]|uniref:hypothetical protein n=1 Tax=Enterococcus mundtii TaxID=53346 RepID=UPI0003C56238|nr:hypothetical protein [Enterococcus mundtii]BAO06754.1 hypothetical protein EMQU_1197 [Enterococcus mundtii QU 25]
MEQPSNRESSFDIGEYYSEKKYKKNFGHLRKTADFKRVLIDFDKQLEETKDQLSKHRNGVLWTRRLLADFRQKKLSKTDRVFNFILRRKNKEPKKYENTLKDLNSKYFKSEYIQSIVAKDVWIDSKEIVDEIERLASRAKSIPTARGLELREQFRAQSSEQKKWRQPETEDELHYSTLSFLEEGGESEKSRKIIIHGKDDSVIYAVIRRANNGEKVSSYIEVSHNEEERIERPITGHHRNSSVHGEGAFTGHHEQQSKQPRRLSPISELQENNGRKNSLKDEVERRDSKPREVKSAINQGLISSKNLSVEGAVQSVKQRILEIENRSGKSDRMVFNSHNDSGKRSFGMTKQAAMSKSGENRRPAPPSPSLKPKPRIEPTK